VGDSDLCIDLVGVCISRFIRTKHIENWRELQGKAI
jgi:hypothetical protein